MCVRVACRLSACPKPVREAPQNWADMCAAIRTILSGQSDPVRPEGSGLEPRLVLDAMQGRMPPPIETRIAVNSMSWSARGR